jgi:hypothetical protein
MKKAFVERTSFFHFWMSKRTIVKPPESPAFPRPRVSNGSDSRLSWLKLLRVMNAFRIIKAKWKSKFKGAGCAAGENCLKTKD